MTESHPTSDEVEDEFRSLLEGLRTTLPGVQLITAFLLTLPLYDHFDDLVAPSGWRTTSPSSAPSSARCSSWRRRRTSGCAPATGWPAATAATSTVAVRLTIVGTVAFAVAIIAVAFLVSSVVLGTGAAIGVAVRRDRGRRVELVLPAAGRLRRKR